jgi:hypothetical protein
LVADSTFQIEVASFPGLVLVDLTALWCKTIAGGSNQFSMNWRRPFREK